MEIIMGKEGDFHKDRHLGTESKGKPFSGRTKINFSGAETSALKRNYAKLASDPDFGLDSTYRQRRPYPALY
jgi:hypothetical protein